MLVWTLTAEFDVHRRACEACSPDPCDELEAWRSHKAACRACEDEAPLTFGAPCEDWRERRLEHGRTCLRCNPCRHLQEAIRGVVDWHIARELLTTAELLRAAENEAGDVNGHTWQPASLIKLAANPPAPPTIGGVLYPGKRTLVSGETESLKTWLALILAKAEMDAGYSVAWADLDAMGSAELLSRLRALGVDDNVIDQRFLYYEPAERLINDVLGTSPPRSPSGRSGCSSSTPSTRCCRCTASTRTAPRTSRRSGGRSPTRSAVPVPHRRCSTTSPRTPARAKYAYGSERKASGAIVHVGFRLLDTADPRRRRTHPARPPQGPARLPAPPQHRPAGPHLGRRRTSPTSSRPT